MSKEELYKVRGFKKDNENTATYTNERLHYGTMQKCVNDCFESGYEKVVIVRGV